MYIRHDSVQAIDFDGLTIFDFTAGLENSSSFAEIRVPAGVRHKHSWSERSDKYYYVVRGTVQFTVDEKNAQLSTGDVCLIPKGSRFHYENNSSEEVVLILVHTPCFNLEFERFED